MSISFFPQTKSGIWSLSFFVAFVFFVSIGMAMVSAGERGGEAVFDNLKISIPMFLAGISAVAGFFTAVYSIIKKKERAVTVFFAALAGIVIVAFVLSEIFLFR